MVAYSFYKNIVYTTPLLLYGIISAWSGQTIYDMYLLTFFNVFFTFWPIVLYALFDLELPINLLVTKPRMYSDGKNRFKLTLWLWTKH